MLSTFRTLRICERMYFTAENKTWTTVRHDPVIALKPKYIYHLLNEKHRKYSLQHKS